MRSYKALFLSFLLLAPATAFAKVNITVSVADQSMDVVVTDDDPLGAVMEGVVDEDGSSYDGTVTYHWDVSTARSGFRTPTGVFTPTRLAEHYVSKHYHAPMPNAIFFRESEGVAIHAATASEVRHLSRPASHGCVRLSPDNAKTLYEIVKREGLKNTTVEVR